VKPICVKCGRFYRVQRNGKRFVEMMPGGNGRRAEPGLEHAEQWTPYKLWVGDLWKCEGCGHELISGVAREPLAEHYQPDFPARLDDEMPRVCDC
jgi:hypothetical protein